MNTTENQSNPPEPEPVVPQQVEASEPPAPVPSDAPLQKQDQGLDTPEPSIPDSDTPGPADAQVNPPEPDAPEQSIEDEVAAAMGDDSVEELMQQQEAQAASPATAEAADGQAVPTEQEPVHHELRRGRISAIRGEDVFVDITGETGKLQGVVPVAQFDRPPRIGSIMDFVVDRVDEGQGLMFLSREGAISRSTWDTLHKGSVVEARCTGSNKGGLELELVGRIRAFMPASQIDLHHVEDLEQFVGQKLEATVTEVDRKHKKVMLSRRAHLEATRKQAKDKLLSTLEVGVVLDGKVSKLMEYGAFVDIGGVDGLVHVSDMAYGHVGKPGDVCQEGDAVRVKVLKVEKKKGRIALGMKQVQPDPWDTGAATINPGDEVAGTVVRTAPFGAFVEVAPGVEALLPISEISWKRINRVEDVLGVGQSVRFKVISLDKAKRKMSLSMKQLAGDPWADSSSKFAVDSWVQGKVVSVQDFGAFVEIEEGVEGLVHISELSDRRVNQVTDIVKVGDEKNFRIKSLDGEKRKIALSLRKDSGSKGGGKGGRGEEAKTFKTTAKKQPKENLKGGMDLGGIGLGGLSLDDLK
ncbi:MAG: S1 RNA-binding domain-containing protein [Planctomycetota bacterium]